MSVDPKSTDEALARLTGPGSLFELQTEDVRGRPMRNFARRPKSLSELVAQAARHGERDFLVQGDRRISYAEFAQLVWGTALRFRGAGLEQGRENRRNIAPHNYTHTVSECGGGFLHGRQVPFSGGKGGIAFFAQDFGYGGGMR